MGAMRGEERDKEAMRGETRERGETTTPRSLSPCCLELGGLMRLVLGRGPRGPGLGRDRGECEGGKGGG